LGGPGGRRVSPAGRRLVDVRTQAVLATPIGGLGVAVADGAVVGVTFGATGEPATGELDPVLAAALAELAEYFAGTRTGFTVPVRFVRGTPFERAVWARIATIPYGEQVTYGQIARDVGEPGGAQAVGAACGRNPVPVIVGCHRVVGAGGTLVGFGGGLPRKRHLLQLEAKVAIEQGLGF
jgi:methylated-DNA-[protein]-cysteine S-methyltransferase